MTNPVPVDHIKAGDTITAQFTSNNDSRRPEDLFTITGRVTKNASGGGALWLAGWIIRDADGESGPSLICIIDRVPEEPPVGTGLFDEDGDLWIRLSNGWFMFAKRQFDTSPVKWSSICTNHDLRPVAE